MSNENIVEELRECAAHAGGEGYTYNVMRRAAAEIKRLRTENATTASAMLESHNAFLRQLESGVLAITAERDALAAELAAIRAAGGEQVEVVVTIQLPDPYDERDGVWINSVDRRKLAALPAGSQLIDRAQHQRIVAAMAAELEKARQDVKNAFNDDLKMRTLRQQEQEIIDLRAELEAAMKQEPAAWIAKCRGSFILDLCLPDADDDRATLDWQPLFALPPLAGKVSGQEWVPVSERLPDDHSYVIVIHDGLSMVGWYATRDEVWRSASMLPLNPTHWMPLPAAPALLATPSMEVNS